MPWSEHGGDHWSIGPIELDFSVNLNPLGLPAAVRAALVDQVDHFAAYPDPKTRVLRTALGQWHGVDPQWIVCGNGAADLIYRLAQAVRPAQGLVLAPTFSEYERAIRLAGGKVVHHQLTAANDFRVGADLLDRVQPGCQLAVVCQPNNPTGRLADPDLLMALARRCRSVGALLLVDECFLPFSDGPSLIDRLDDHPNLVVLRAFTKLYAMAGLRLGYLVTAQPDLLDRLRAWTPPWTVSAAAEAAGLAALDLGPSWIETTRRTVADLRQSLTAGLSALGLTVTDSQANYVLARAAHPLAQSLAARGLLVRDCSNFIGLDSHYHRFAVRPAAEQDRLLTVLAQVLGSS
ncbi:MAG: threonine-phosphate decarboxylase CobD [Propionibacteriaceae bacterium]|jgi:threonine-phosphate decarboxylase|nr:threonine-phosphate decarboxylase CobD [Propionibacteriaceae bacterium]